MAVETTNGMNGKKTAGAFLLATTMLLYAKMQEEKVSCGQIKPRPGNTFFFCLPDQNKVFALAKKQLGED